MIVLKGLGFRGKVKKKKTRYMFSHRRFAGITLAGSTVPVGMQANTAALGQPLLGTSSKGCCK